MRRALCIVLLLSFVLVSEIALGQAVRRRTAAERSDFQETSLHKDVLADIDYWAKSSAHINRLDFGRTTEERALSAVIIAKPPVKAASELQRDSRLRVLIIGNIHGGEVAGKEALLIMLRELANNPGHPWLQKLVLIFVPNYNADGNDRIGSNESHRRGQLGPDKGMGWRQNAQGLDLNRDFLKLEAAETRALVGLMNRFDPHVFIDAHTTNGSKHRYQLTYDISHNPACPKEIRAYLRNKLLPRVSAQLSEDGLDTFYYGNFNRAHDRWLTYGYEGRYSTEYFGLRGRLAILSEAYSYVSYKTRIEASKAFISECLTQLSRDAKAVHELCDRVRKKLTAVVKNPKDSQRVAIKAKVAPFAKKVVLKGYENSNGQKPAQHKDYTVTFYGDYKATDWVQKPYAYVLDKNLSRVVGRLKMHGITVEEFTETTKLPVEVYRITGLRGATRSFQGHRLKVASTERKELLRSIPKGAYLVRTAQALGQLVVTLLEPESTDSLLTWNFFDHRIKRGAEFPVFRLATSVHLKTKSAGPVLGRRRLSLDEIYGGGVNFWGRFGRARWLTESRYSQRVGNRAMAVDASSGAAWTHKSEGPEAKSFLGLPGFSKAEASAIVRARRQATRDQSAWLFEYANDLFYLSKKSGKARRLTHSAEREELASFSPDGRMIAFVRNFNIYVISVEDGKELALTTKGHKKLLHGKLDWVYQEELYGRGRFKAYWWSPNSTHIAFLRLDESPVKDYTVTDHIPVRGRLEVTSYPKAGDPLPRVSLGVVAALGGSTRWVETPRSEGLERLIGRVSWSPDGQRLLYQILNRRQNHLDLRSADPRSGQSWSLIEERSKAWVEIIGDPIWLKNGDFLWLSDRTGHRHIYLHRRGQKALTALTQGPWSVRRVHGLDAKEQWIYISASKDSAIESHGYRIKIDGTKLSRLTGLGESHSLQFNKEKTHFIASSSSVHRPPHQALYSAKGRFIRAIEPNSENILDAYQLNKPEFYKVPTRDGYLLNAMLIKPPDFNPKKKYPVLCYVYSGPGAPSVRNRWGGNRYLWHQMLAQEGYCIWICDNRSASSTGIKQTWPIYRKLGQKELIDLEDGLRWLGKKGFVDSKRIGIWGWSYGGYMTSYALTHSKMFKVGIAGAPVTDWRNYDAIYTERYMGLPQDNPKGYRSSSAVTAAADLQGRLLLIHGSIDDNVHLSNTLQLAEALQRAGKHFDLMIYPRNRHGISRSGQSRHLRELMTRFIRKNL
jgi:dipeptidyl-peptidase 4